MEGVRENFNLTDKYAANGFLEILVSMRWVIMQDFVVLIRNHKRSHFTITPIDYGHKLSVLMADQH